MDCLVIELRWASTPRIKNHYICSLGLQIQFNLIRMIEIIDKIPENHCYKNWKSITVRETIHTENVGPSFACSLFLIVKNHVYFFIFKNFLNCKVFLPCACFFIEKFPNWFCKLIISFTRCPLNLKYNLKTSKNFNFLMMMKKLERIIPSSWALWKSENIHLHCNALKFVFCFITFQLHTYTHVYICSFACGLFFFVCFLICLFYFVTDW